MEFVRGLVGMTAVVVLLAACQGPAPAPVEDNSPEAMIELGRSIIETAACPDCHTPKLFGGTEENIDARECLAIHPEAGCLFRFDQSRWLSGHPEDAGVPDSLPFEFSADPGGWGVAVNNHFTAWSGPWGISFGINLTPDQETGIGTWTEEMFITTLRSGKHQGEGRDLLPPMPWLLYGDKTDRELRAMYAYLMSIPPVSNVVPEPIPPEDLQP